MNKLQYLDEEINLLQSLKTDENFEQAKNLLLNAIKSHHHIFTAGNGGSSSTASHIVNDLVKAINLKNEHIKCSATCLSDNIPLITAISNDISYDECFSQQLTFCGAQNDVLMVFSGSGNSTNIVNALNVAKGLKMTSIAIVAYDGGKSKDLADITIHIPTFNMQIAEDIHLVVAHLLYRYLLDEI